MKVLVTGATGLLGRAVYKAFVDAGWRPIGQGFTRARDGILKVDLRDPAAIAALIAEQKPDVIIHAAAERRPDVCEKDPTTEELNVAASWGLARAAAAHSSHLIYISTDYMFDGKGAPYKETAQPSPLNTYGHLKLRGEYAVLAGHARPVILRVPLLFGPTTDLNESACTAFAAVAQNSSKQATVDDWQIRVPTYTVDIAHTLVNVARALVAGGKPGGSAGAGAAAAAGGDDKLAEVGRSLGGIYNYTAPERFTRYELVKVFARLLGVPSLDHVTVIQGMPPGAPRPYDCHLDDAKLRATGLAAPNTPFEVAARQVLGLPPA